MKLRFITLESSFPVTEVARSTGAPVKHTPLSPKEQHVWPPSFPNFCIRSPYFPEDVQSCGSTRLGGANRPAVIHAPAIVLASNGWTCCVLGENVPFRGLQGVTVPIKLLLFLYKQIKRVTDWDKSTSLDDFDCFMCNGRLLRREQRWRYIITFVKHAIHDSVHKRQKETENKWKDRDFRHHRAMRE